MSGACPVSRSPPGVTMHMANPCSPLFPVLGGEAKTRTDSSKRMPIYFLVHEPRWFHDHVGLALAASWRLRSFEPCRPLCMDMTAAAEKFVQRFPTGDQPLFCQVAAGLPFDRHVWRYLVGEILLYTAAAIPEFQTTPDALRCLTSASGGAPGPKSRERFGWIEQAHFGARDLLFGGGFYRPEHAGYNDTQDVAHLAACLSAVDPDRWNPDDLQALPDLEAEEDRADELAFAREWFPSLQELYQGAAEQGQLIVCEVL